jgi:hypothetical protein
VQPNLGSISESVPLPRPQSDERTTRITTSILLHVHHVLHHVLLLRGILQRTHVSIGEIREGWMGLTSSSSSAVCGQLLKLRGNDLLGVRQDLDEVPCELCTTSSVIDRQEEEREGRTASGVEERNGGTSLSGTSSSSNPVDVVLNL